ncbi:MAG: RNA pseudouridine synthase [Candidatus Sedimenticola sp. (ex Thyasira tokunagai)]
MCQQQIETHIDVAVGSDTAVNLLAQASGLSKQRIKSAMQKGAVWLTSGKNTRRLRRQAKTMKAGDKLHLYYDESILNAEPLPAQLIADEGAYSVWYKPYGMFSQGSKWGDHCTLYRWAEQHLTPQRNAFIVHRLDRAATGLVLLAHQKKAATALANLFQQRAINKRYMVVVHGRFSAADSATTIDSEIDGRQACTHAKLIEYDPESDRSLLDITIETGRKHQIRAHLAGIGFPVVGDRLHGGEADAEDLQLTAYHLSFTCPLGNGDKLYTLPSHLRPGL